MSVKNPIEKRKFCELPEFLKNTIGANVSKEIERLLQTVKKSNSDDQSPQQSYAVENAVEMALKTYYIPLKKSEDIDEEEFALFRESQSDDTFHFTHDGRIFFKMTYANIVKYATPQQAEEYHQLRKKYLCWAMSEATSNTGLCFQIMGSDSPASDVDITIFPRELIIKNTHDFMVAIEAFNGINQEHFYDPINDIFDANVYATQFLQIIPKAKLPTDANFFVRTKQSQPLKGNLSTLLYSHGCYEEDNNFEVNAVAIHIPYKNTYTQRVFALARLSKFWEKHVKAHINSVDEFKPLLQTLETYMISDSGNSAGYGKYDRYRQVLKDTEKMAGIDSSRHSHTVYKELLLQCYNMRNEYLANNKTQDREADAENIVNLLSAATFYSNDAYHSQGAFLDINGYEWDIKLSIHDCINSMLENFGFLLEYAHGSEHNLLDKYARYAKMIKYFKRITATCIKMLEFVNVRDPQAAKIMLMVENENATKLDEQRKAIQTSTAMKEYLCNVKNTAREVYNNNAPTRSFQKTGTFCIRDMPTLAKQYVLKIFRIMKELNLMDFI